MASVSTVTYLVIQLVS